MVDYDVILRCILRVLGAFLHSEYSPYSQYQPDEILPVLVSTRSTEPSNTLMTAVFHKQSIVL